MTTPPIQPGQYWRTRAGLIRYVASIFPEWSGIELPVIVLFRCDNTGEIVQESYSRKGRFYDDKCRDADEDLVTYLPDCTSLDWVPIEYPEYVMSSYASAEYAYIRRDSPTSGEIVYRNGHTEPYLWTEESQSFMDKGIRIYITKEQAESRVQKPVPPLQKKYYKSSMTDSGYFRVDSNDSYFWIKPDGREVRQCGSPDILKKHPFVEIAKAEAEKRVKKSDAVPSPDQRDFPEDLVHENGNYTCRCVVCGSMFTGLKRRVCCKVCKERLSSQSPKPPSHHTAPKVWSLIEDAYSENYTTNKEKRSPFTPIWLLIRICSAQQSMLSELSAQVDALRSEKTNRGGCCGQPD